MSEPVSKPRRRGRSTKTVGIICSGAGGVAAPPGANFGVGGGVPLVGIAEHGLDVGLSEAAPDGFQGPPGIDQLGGVDVAKLMNRGRDLGFLAVSACEEEQTRVGFASLQPRDSRRGIAHLVRDSG